MASDGPAQSSGVKKFVAVAGNIGVGKSTLVGLLSRRLGWEPFYEPVGENPYLADFYRDMRAWSFQSQIFFLTRRLRSHRQLCDHATSAIQDPCQSGSSIRERHHPRRHAPKSPIHPARLSNRPLRKSRSICAFPSAK